VRVSAICGIFHLDGKPAHRDDVAAQTDALAHRGPDAHGEWTEGSVGLGHRVLYTTAESRRERQPLVHESGTLVLVADARIDNRRELATTLGIPRLDRAGDAEVILAAYERWGTSCAERLIGDFAFAIWDRRSESVFCARDPMGVKPFYYHRSDRLFAFASEIKALLCIPGVPRLVDDRAVARYIACLHDDRETTQFVGISRLPAARTMTVSRRGITRSEYWRPDPAREVRYSTDDQYVEAFSAIFTEAVRARLRSELPVGATLSGGLDSSSLVCTARSISSSQRLPTFSLVFPSLPSDELKVIDEREFIESVLRIPGLAPHFVRGDLLSPLRDLPRVLWHLDEPHVAPNLYLHWALYGAARDSGVRVLLDGFDGDATISHGFGRLNTLMANGDWPTFDREVRAFADHRGKPAESVLPHFGFPFLSALARRGQVRPWLRTAGELTRRFPVSRRELATSHGFAPAFSAAMGRARQSAGSHDASSAILRPEFARAIARELRDVDASTTAMSSAGEREMHLDTVSQPLYQLTLEIADKAARAFGVEPRYPFFDRRLIEFCLGLPDEQKFAGGWPRYLFRRAMQGVLPADIQWRATKGNLAPNFDRRFRAVDRPVVDDACSDGSALRRFVDPRALGKVARRYFAGVTWGDQDGLLLFRTTVLSTWLDGAHADDRRSDEVVASDNVVASKPRHGTAARLDRERAVCLET
jgi:asparagine synthase (glutamine-hydrolysing)